MINKYLCEKKKCDASSIAHSLLNNMTDQQVEEENIYDDVDIDSSSSTSSNNAGGGALDLIDLNDDNENSDPSSHDSVSKSKKESNIDVNDK